jgi:hypothetical protein
MKLAQSGLLQKKMDLKRKKWECLLIFFLNPRYCIAVDLADNYDINYSELQNAEVPSLLNKTIDEIKKRM